MNEIPQNKETGFPRAIYPLLLLYFMKDNEIVGKVRLQRLIYAIQKRIIEQLKWGITTETYRFWNDNYGPYTDDIYDDITTLELLKMINITQEGDKKKYKLSPLWIKIAEKMLSDKRLTRSFLPEIKKIARELGSLPLDKLIRKINGEYEFSI